MKNGVGERHVWAPLKLLPKNASVRPLYFELSTSISGKCQVTVIRSCQHKIENETF